jgi:hypothetical protein
MGSQDKWYKIKMDNSLACSDNWGFSKITDHFSDGLFREYTYFVVYGSLYHQ